MNDTETLAFMQLIQTLHNISELALQLLNRLEERDHDRHPRVAGLSGGRRVPVRSDGTYYNFSATHATIPPADRPGDILRGQVGLDADRGESRADDPARADADRDARLWDVGENGHPTPIQPGYPGDHSRLHSGGRPGAGAEPGDRGGDPVPPGGDGAGDDPGRVGDGDAGAESWTEAKHNSGGVISPELHQIMLEDGTARLVTRCCMVCGKHRRLTEFEVGRHVCRECEPPPPPPVVATDAPPPKPVVAGRIAAGKGTCSCGHVGDLWVRAGGGPDNGQVGCLACLQAAEREKGHCVICGHPIIGRRSTATTCGPECQREAHRRQCADYYEQKKKARAVAAATPAGGV